MIRVHITGYNCTCPRKEFIGCLIIMLADGSAALWPCEDCINENLIKVLQLYLFTSCKQHCSFTPSCANSNSMHRRFDILNSIVYCKCFGIISIFLTLLIINSSISWYIHRFKYFHFWCPRWIYVQMDWFLVVFILKI